MHSHSLFWYYIRSTLCVQTALLSRGHNPFDVYIKCYCGRWGKMSLRGVYPQLGVQTADWLRQTRPDTWAPLLSLFTANLLVSHWDSSNIEWPQFPCHEKKGLGRERTREQINKRGCSHGNGRSVRWRGRLTTAKRSKWGKWALYKYNT